MAPLAVSRRTMLRGAGGVALALPALEVMRGSRPAGAAVGDIKRFVICQAGVSLGSCYQVSDGRFNLVTPLNTGAKYEMPVGLQAIGQAGVQSEMGLVSGLFIPVNGYRAPGTPVPPDLPKAGSPTYHGGTHYPQFAGTTKISGEPRDRGDNPSGPSCDQLLVDVISSPDQYMKTLPLRTEAYYGSGGDYGMLSWNAPREGAPRDPFGLPLATGIPPFIHPSAIYQALFDSGGASGSGPPLNPEGLQARKRQKVSVLDAVRKKTERLISSPRLGQQDRRQMELWRDHIRTIETRIEQLDPTKCPAPDPADYTKGKDPSSGYLPKDDLIYDSGANWGNETERARIQADLIKAAFSCDRTRVVSWLLTATQSDLNMLPDYGLPMGHHKASHSFSSQMPTNMAKAVDWHVRRVAYLVKLLKETIDYDGSPMIDNTVILLIFEGGAGGRQHENFPDRTGEYAQGVRFSHTTDDMIVVMAGGRNLGLHCGQHIRCSFDMSQNTNATNVHPGDVVFTVMKQMGFTGRLGDLPDRIVPGMLKSPS